MKGITMSAGTLAPGGLAQDPLDLTRLEYLWMHSDCRTLTEFATKRGLDPKAFIRQTQGWAKRREAMRKHGENGGIDGATARERLLMLWWRVLDELSACIGPEGDESRLKSLSVSAGVLKAAHGGVGGLLNLSDQATLTPITIEGLNVDAL
jgi:hypothetical protein